MAVHTHHSCLAWTRCSDRLPWLWRSSPVFLVPRRLLHNRLPAKKPCTYVRLIFHFGTDAYRMQLPVGDCYLVAVGKLTSRECRCSEYAAKKGLGGCFAVVILGNPSQVR